MSHHPCVFIKDRGGIQLLTNLMATCSSKKLFCLWSFPHQRASFCTSERSTNKCCCGHWLNHVVIGSKWYSVHEWVKRAYCSNRFNRRLSFWDPILSVFLTKDDKHTQTRTLIYSKWNSKCQERMFDHHTAN